MTEIIVNIISDPEKLRKCNAKLCLKKNKKKLLYLQIDLNSRCTAFHTPESEMTTSKELVMFSDRFFQIMENLPWSVFDQCVTRYDGYKYVKKFI